MWIISEVYQSTGIESLAPKDVESTQTLQAKYVYKTYIRQIMTNKTETRTDMSMYCRNGSLQE